MRLYLFRHGLSDANQAKLVTGTPADSLSTVGVAQVNRLSQWVKELDITADYYFFSHWQRAQQTAKIIFPDVDWFEDKRLGETDAGTVASLTLDSFLKEQPDFYREPDNCYPGGESHKDLYTRVLSWLRELLQRSYESVVIVSHAGPIACILHELLNIPLSQFPSILPSNSTLVIIDADLVAEKIVGKIIGLSLGSIDNLRDSLKG
ncbi:MULTISPECIES: histidine phosphatase family protein [Rahnella]|uniref:phosphoglycerate mutase (2,3-diphosphoglycerate-dependent) n=1 Tax=Rahnella laticis TaxID=2787622 RepID=A0ABS0E589_9GAMM|nr:MULTISPECIES: histidine phosphatase family protein [Rahnella]MBF7980255.1 histidine phosphatase family protein [Rahnella laticis]MBF8000486.1 histidine phosphatase family protein [Rahnella sp. LAC-M12]